MNFPDLIQILNERYNTFQNLWLLYITVVLGVLAYLSTSASTSSSRIVRTLLFVGFIGFSHVNLEALSDVLVQRRELVELAKRQLADESRSAIFGDDKQSWGVFVEEARPYRDRQLRWFHRSADGMVLLAIWLLPTYLVRVRAPFQISSKQVCPIRSSLPAAVISWDQTNEQWVLAEQYRVTVMDVHFLIPDGFTFDLASVPKFLWSVIAPFELSVVAPLVHDFIYRNNGYLPEHANADPDTRENKRISRSQADLIFLEIMEKEGVPYLRRTLGYYAVRIFGRRAYAASI